VDSGPIEAVCHCGAVRIRLPRAPEQITRCNCSWCRKNASRAVYFGSDELDIKGELDGYVRTDIDEPMIRFMRCRNCGVQTHWEPLDEPPHARMGINANLIDPAVLKGVKQVDVDGASW
jgi:hypothetical protein